MVGILFSSKNDHGFKSMETHFEDNHNESVKESVC